MTLWSHFLPLTHRVGNILCEAWCKCQPEAPCSHNRREKKFFPFFHGLSLNVSWGLYALYSNTHLGLTGTQGTQPVTQDTGCIHLILTVLHPHTVPQAASREPVWGGSESVGGRTTKASGHSPLPHWTWHTKQKFTNGTD